MRRFVIGKVLTAIFFVVTLATPAQEPPQSPNLAIPPQRLIYKYKKEGRKVNRIIKNAVITAYSSTPDQTDGDPFIAAWGDRVFLGMVANNCLSRDTVVEIFGWRYRVRDRMHSRYGCNRFDIWLPSREHARRFGIRSNVEVRILERAGQ